MAHLILAFIVIGILLAVIAAMSAVMRRQGAKGSESDADDDAQVADYDGYERRRYLFSPAEYSFYRVLHLAVGADHAIQAKVRIADLVEVRKGSARWQTKVNMVTRKHVNFLLCEAKTMVPMLAIELDDRSHNSAKSQKRDGFVNGLMAAVGMPLLRVPAARGYEVQEVKAMVEKALEAEAA
jgi:hypothetical protein